MARREYRVIWLREGNDQPRSKKLGNSRKRAEAYLAAVCAATPDERYGDKVDKPWHCQGNFGYDEPPCEICHGETWREKWESKFGLKDNDGYRILKPVLWAKIESRPVAPWEEAKAVAPPMAVYGTVLARGERRIMVTDPAERKAVVVEDGSTFGERIGGETLYGLGMWEPVE